MTCHVRGLCLEGPVLGPPPCKGLPPACSRSDTRYTSTPVQPHVAGVNKHTETSQQRCKSRLATCPRAGCSVHCSSAYGPCTSEERPVQGTHPMTLWTGSGHCDDLFLPKLTLLKKDWNLFPSLLPVGLRSSHLPQLHVR